VPDCGHGCLPQVDDFFVARILSFRRMPSRSKAAIAIFSDDLNPVFLPNV
jgi:hypothetical protein